MVVDKELGGEVLGVGTLGLEQRQVIGTCSSHAGNWNGNSQEHNQIITVASSKKIQKLFLIKSQNITSG